MGEARMEDVGAGLVPATDGWFVVNVRDAAWMATEAFGARCAFEGDPRLLGERPDLEPVGFPQLGIRLAVPEPGKPSGLYHAETAQEDFLVLSGECVALVDGEERTLRAWDFLHLRADVEHTFVGAGDGPCVLLMIGARTPGRGIVYPYSELARRHGASAQATTDSPREAYAPLPPWRPAQAPSGPWLGS